MARSQPKSTPAASPAKGRSPEPQLRPSQLLDVRVSLWSRIVLVAVVVTLFLLCCFPLVDTDLWWHLKTGQLIWQKKEIPRFDWYTYKDADKPWIDLHWGFQVLMAGLHGIGGGDLIILFKATAYSLTAWIGWRVTGDRLPAWLKGLVWVCPLVLLSGRAMERPEMLTMVFLATSLWILHRAASRPNLLWYLVPLQLVWTNCHALFVLGLVVIWCFVADWLFRKMIGQTWLSGISEETPELSVQQVLLPVIAATLVCLINPYFHHGFLFPFELFKKFSTSRALYASVGEFQPPRQFISEKGWTNISPIALAVLFVLTVSSFAAPLFRQRVSLFRLLLLTGFGWLAWTAVRNQNVFALIAAVVISGNLEDFSRRPAGEVRLSEANVGRLWLNRGVVLLYGVWIFTIVTSVWGLSKWTDGYRLFALGERRGWFAHGAARWAGIPGMPKSAYVTNFGQAAVYTYHNGPDRKVFMDPRLEVVSPQTYALNDQVLEWMRRGDPRWMDAVRNPQGELPALIIDSRYSRGEFNGILLSMPETWRLVFADEAAALLVETAVADRLKLPIADPTPLMKPPDY